MPVNPAMAPPFDVFSPLKIAGELVEIGLAFRGDTGLSFDRFEFPVRPRFRH